VRLRLVGSAWLADSVCLASRADPGRVAGDLVRLDEDVTELGVVDRGGRLSRLSAD